MSISPARAVAFDILLRVDQQNAYAGELLHSERLEKLAPADRGLAMELVMGVLRWRSRLDDAIAAASSRPLKKLDAEVLNALRLAAYQLQFLTRVPAHAAINDSVELVKRAQKRSAAPFANAVLRKIAAAKTMPAQPRPTRVRLLPWRANTPIRSGWLSAGSAQFGEERSPANLRVRSADARDIACVWKTKTRRESWRRRASCSRLAPCLPALALWSRET